MTYSNQRHQSGHHSGLRSPSPFTTNPALTNDAYFAALAPGFRAVLAAAMVVFSKFLLAAHEGLHPDFDRNSKKVKIAALGLILFMIALPGSRNDKTEFLGRMFERVYAKRNARLIELRAEYIVWRQRKCWMWGGGFRNASLAILPDVFMGKRDLMSFDALIPD